MNEIFLDIPRITKYKVSNLGNVISFARKEHVKMLKLNKESTGYTSVKLPVNNKFRTCLVHILVAKAFLKNPENKKQVNHINGIKDDNRIENLEWVTPKENAQHAVKTGLTKIKYGEETSNSKLKKEQVKKILELSKTMSARKIAKIYGVDNTTISDIIRGTSWKNL